MATQTYSELNRYYLKKNLTILVSVILIFALGYALLHNYQQDAASKTQAVQHTLDQTLNRVIYFQRQLRLAKTYEPVYRQYESDKILPRQDRVKWTDELLTIKQELMMVPFTMQFEPEEQAKADQFENLKLTQPIFFTTQLNLTAGLQSDADVIRLFKQINQRISPMYFIKECHLQATPKEIEKAKFRVKRANMNLQCSLVLFLAKPRAFQQK